VFNVGPLELIVVLIIALIVLGPQRLPDVARSLGRGMREFRGALERSGDDEDDGDDPEPEYGYEPSSAEESEVKPDEDSEAKPDEDSEAKPDGYQKEADSSEPSSSSRDLV
jgi:sec-independent protein translocase protein TatA